jgi:hypothetical protein
VKTRAFLLAMVENHDTPQPQSHRGVKIFALVMNNGLYSVSEHTIVELRRFAAYPTYYVCSLKG